MQRHWFIALLGLFLGVGCFGFLYTSRTADYRKLEESCGPELAWIKKEFKLTGQNYERVRQLHQAYKPVCAEMCRRVDAKDAELSQLLQNSKEVTPQIEEVLGQAAQLREECQTEMLRHFFQVSQAMPPDQGKRYLSWIQAQTLTPTHESMVPKMDAQPAHDDRASH
jgi:hypothetical protein